MTDTSSQITARNSMARDIVAGFASATPTLAAAWRTVGAALADSDALAADVARLSAELAAARLELAAAWLERANLLAAMRATLAADGDGEPDPLYYLRDDLDALQERSEGRGGAS